MKGKKFAKKKSSSWNSSKLTLIKAATEIRGNSRWTAINLHRRYSYARVIQIDDVKFSRFFTSIRVKAGKSVKRQFSLSHWQRFNVIERCREFQVYFRLRGWQRGWNTKQFRKILEKIMMYDGKLLSFSSRHDVKICVMNLPPRRIFGFSVILQVS